jgi:predicted GIY-YIG superfamily endonuclease
MCTNVHTSSITGSAILKVMWFLYILECTDGSLYTGITNNLERRLEAHKNKKGGSYTRSRTVKKMVYSEKKRTKSSALRRELEIKSWPRARKLAFISSHKKNIIQ